MNYGGDSTIAVLPLGDVLVPIVGGMGGGVTQRTQNGSTYANSSIYLHGGTGVISPDGKGVQGGFLTGTNTGLYFQINNSGVQLALPDTGFYSPVGGAGISIETSTSEWILTTDKAVELAGGYENFGKKMTINGYSDYNIYKSDENRLSLEVLWASNGMLEVYGPLEVIP